MFAITFLLTISKKTTKKMCFQTQSFSPWLNPFLNYVHAKLINRKKHKQSCHFKITFLKSLRISFVEHKRDFLLSNIPRHSSFLPTEDRTALVWEPLKCLHKGSFPESSYCVYKRGDTRVPPVYDKSCLE